MTNIGILYFDWIHPRNEEGLLLIRDKLGIDVIKIDNRTQIDNYPGKWIILSTSEPCPNIYPDKLVISGPHFFPLNLQYPIVYNALAEWVQNWVKLLPNILTIGIFFPIKEPINNNIVRDTVIVYIKHRSPVDITTLEKIIPPSVSYFNYNQGYDYNSWLQTLKRAKYAIWCGSSESQGYALQECLVHNVPVILIDVMNWSDNYPLDGTCTHIENFLRIKINATSAPIWDENCGIKTTMENLGDSIAHMERTYLTYNPQESILKKLSPEVIYNQYLKYYQDLHYKDTLDI